VVGGAPPATHRSRAGRDLLVARALVGRRWPDASRDRRRVPRVGHPRRRPSWGKPPRAHLGRAVASGGPRAGWGRVALRRRRIRQLFPRAPRLPVAKVVPERPQVARAPAPPRHPRGGNQLVRLRSIARTVVEGSPFHTTRLSTDFCVAPG